MAECVALFDKLEMELPKGFSLMDESEQLLPEDEHIDDTSGTCAKTQ